MFRKIFSSVLYVKSFGRKRKSLSNVQRNNKSKTCNVTITTINNEIHIQTFLKILNKFP